MKKNNGGYVLAYVMIVITVVSAMALAVGSVAVRNLQVQEAAVERMQDLYAAEGEIERFRAWVIEKEIGVITTYPLVNPPANSTVTVKVTVVTQGSPATITVTATANGTTVTAGMTVTFDNSDGKVDEIKYTSYNITATQ